MIFRGSQSTVAVGINGSFGDLRCHLSDRYRETHRAAKKDVLPPFGATFEKRQPA
jgi:hypothetical protein